jgi:hypothetical protein
MSDEKKRSSHRVENSPHSLVKKGRSYFCIFLLIGLIIGCGRNKRYDYMSKFDDDGLAEVELNGKQGFIDKTGKEIIPCKYDKAWYFSEGLACVRLDGERIYIDKQGNEDATYIEAKAVIADNIKDYDNK